MFEKVFETAEIAKYNPEEQRGYEESLKVYRDLINAVRSAERKGIEKGIHSIAKNMLLKGLDVNTICDLTGLTEQQITELDSKS